MVYVYQYSSVTFKLYIEDDSDMTSLTIANGGCPNNNNWNQKTYDYYTDVYSNILRESIYFTESTGYKYFMVKTGAGFAIEVCTESSLLDSSEDSYGCDYICPYDCNDSGTCDPTSGLCTCATGYGDSCSSVDWSSSEYGSSDSNQFGPLLIVTSVVVPSLFLALIIFSVIMCRRRRFAYYRHHQHQNNVVYAYQAFPGQLNTQPYNPAAPQNLYAPYVPSTPTYGAVQAPPPAFRGAM